MFKKDSITLKKPLVFNRGVMKKPDLSLKFKNTHSPLDFSKKKGTPPPDIESKYKRK